MFRSLVFVFISAFVILTAVPVYAEHAININTANKEILTTLTGIGEVKAQAIIDYREMYGPFSAPQEILNVSGIGTATYESIKDHIVVTETVQEFEEGNEVEEEAVTTSESPEESVGGGGFTEDAKSISVDVGENRTVFVGADSVFSALVIGTTGDLIENARVVWSFGDGGTKEGQAVLYNFVYPGTYVVHVTASNGVYSATERITVTAIPALLSVTKVTNEYIAIKNETGVEVDVGRWILFSSGKQFQFPEHTTLLPDQEVFVSNKRTGLSGNDPSTVALQYPNGLVAAVYEYPLFIQQPVALTKPPVEGKVSKVVEEKDQEDAALREEHITAPIVAAQAPQGVWPWLFGVAIVSGIGSGAVIYARRRKLEYVVEEVL